MRVLVLFLFVAEAYTGTVLRHYEETLSEVIALAFFIPLLIGTGGNTGMQTVSTLVRALAVGEVQFRDIFKVIRKEVTTGLMTSATISLIAYGRALLLGVDWNVGLVVGITALTIVIWASFVAAILPLILYKLEVDPAVVSSPFISLPEAEDERKENKYCPKYRMCCFRKFYPLKKEGFS